MALNRNSNVYTVIYATVLTVLVAVLLSAAALGLKDQQKKNTDNEKKQQILMAVQSKLDETVTFENAGDVWSKLNMDENTYYVNHEGEIVDGEVNPFEVSAKTLFSQGMVKEDALLPLYRAEVGENTYYIMTMYGAGLWGPIWGYIAVDAEGNVAGCSFDHDSETAGLGAKIKDDPAFAASFIGKNIYTDGEFTSVSVVKAGKAATYGGEKVDAITGATKTSDCVSVMVYESLKGYVPFLKSLKGEGSCCQKGEGCCGKCGEGCECCQADSCMMDSCKMAECPNKAE